MNDPLITSSVTMALSGVAIITNNTPSKALILVSTKYLHYSMDSVHDNSLL